MKHWLPYKLRFLRFKLEKYVGVFKDSKIRVTQVFLRYGSKVKEEALRHTTKSTAIWYLCPLNVLVIETVTDYTLRKIHVIICYDR